MMRFGWKVELPFNPDVHQMSKSRKFTLN